MTLKQVMSQLKRFGTAQNRKIYKRHGASDNLFGVSFANLYKLQKKIKVDHDLSVKLWNTGNNDAQTLALLVADPTKFTSALADKWVKEINYYMLGGYLASLVAKTKFAEKKMDKWMKIKSEYVKKSGYSLLNSFLRDGNKLPLAKLRKILKTIEKEIHSSPNRAREAMNYSVMSIGIYCSELEKEAIAAAKRIGKVDIDHGETNCKTPDAVEYIKKAKAWKKKKKR